MPNVSDLSNETVQTSVSNLKSNTSASDSNSSPRPSVVNTIFIGVDNKGIHTEQKNSLYLQIIFKGFLICVYVILGSLGCNLWLLKNNKEPTFPPVWVAQFIAKYIPELQSTQEHPETDQERPETDEEEILKRLQAIESAQEKPSDEESLKDAFDSAK